MFKHYKWLTNKKLENDTLGSDEIINYITNNIEMFEMFDMSVIVVARILMIQMI